MGEVITLDRPIGCGVAVEVVGLEKHVSMLPSFSDFLVVSKHFFRNSTSLNFVILSR